MAISVRIPQDLDLALEEVAKREHVSKHSLLLRGAELVVQRSARRDEIDEAVDFVLSHDAELLRRLEDA